MIDLYVHIRRQLEANNANYRGINTFRVFPASMNVDSTTLNLAATVFDKNSLFFFSKTWKENRYTPNDISWAFPLLFCVELGAKVEITAPKSFLMEYSFQMGCLVALPETPTGNPSEYTQIESINDAFYKTQSLLMLVLGDIAQSLDIRQQSVRMFRVESPASKTFGTAIEAELITSECYSYD